MLTRRKQVRYVAFDLLHLDGANLQSLPLVKRKERLRRILPSRSPQCFTLTTREPVGQNYTAPAVSLTWKASNYSQKEGRADLFKRAG